MGVTSKRKPGSSQKSRAGAEAEPVQAVVPSRTRAEHYAAGKALRVSCPRDAHAVWKAPGTGRARST